MPERSPPFMERVEFDTNGGCWLWTGHINSFGYGHTNIGKKTLKAHRLSYEMFRGPIPDGAMIDHLCRVRCCVNPNHLEPVSNRENVLRGVGYTASNAKKTHCLRGHELTEHNLIQRRRGTGYRECRECKNLRDNQARRFARARLKGGQKE